MIGQKLHTTGAPNQPKMNKSILAKIYTVVILTFEGSLPSLSVYKSPWFTLLVSRLGVVKRQLFPPFINSVAKELILPDDNQSKIITESGELTSVVFLLHVPGSFSQKSC